MDIIQAIVTKSQWIIAILALFVVAWARFNSPPTNRSGTTFALFFWGVIFYYALMIPLWLVVMIGLVQGSIGFDFIVGQVKAVDPKAQAQLDQYAPIVAVLIIVVASQFRQVARIDRAARAFCVRLAAIPREADRLAFELAQTTGFVPRDDLRSKVTKIVSENIGPQALSFSRDGTLPDRFTRAIGLYNLFVGPRQNAAALDFTGNGYGRSAYAMIMQMGDAVAARADARYEEMMHAGLAFFTSSLPTPELKDALNRNIAEVTNLTCGLVSRYVLFCERTHSGRLQRLARMGFAYSPGPTFGLDQWATTIFLVTAWSIGMMVFMPGTLPIDVGKVLAIAVTFGASIGFAVLGAIVVAQRFIGRKEGNTPGYPPIAELVVAGLVVVGLSIALRIGIPLVSALMQGGGYQDVLRQFIERLYGVITPFICTISLGLICSYMGCSRMSWYRVAALGALANGAALTCAGWLVAHMIGQQVLAQFYVHPQDAIQLVALSTGLTGFIVGGMVLAVFNESERIRNVAAERIATSPHKEFPLHDAPSIAGGLEPPPVTSRFDVADDLGYRDRAGVEAFEGDYVCFRPAFSNPEIISAYIIGIHWDEAESCLMFEERERVDAGHTQRGRVYIPDGRPFLNFVTLEKGAIRLIMVSRPDKRNESARGLITTLSNPGGAQFTPASAPIVLRRVVDHTLPLGFIRPGALSYESYRRELEMVVPVFGVFAPAPPQAACVAAE
ncbi:hypothetical protein JQ636_04100 [Bradyrhizobium japonicum]|uniref:hypothetical protein n=1 Tax=Bradyrhizobium japonicum TaxID=375 RepID=UPI001BAB7A7D|nr:hypothetical protein [Bradyrhizobium japonicum]MBR0728344.1 hypothetical protein [Bradyrhizobium japonicum]MBR0802711.1 hypothetical protein [Bradyrhizobium japonicum]